MLPVVGTAFSALIVLLVIYFGEVLPLSLLLIGALAAGILGNFSVENFAVYSYASDVSAETSRTKQIGVLESMAYLGGTLSLVLSGVWLTESQSFASMFWCIIACNLAILAYAIVALPESLKLPHVTTSGWSRSTHLRLFRSIGDNLLGYFKLLLTNWKLSLLMVMFFVVEVNFLGISDVVIFYSLGEPLCWSPNFIGYFLALKFFLNGMATLFLLPLLSALGVKDTILIIFGLVSGAAALVIMGIATETWIMFTVPVIGSVRSWVEPCIRSMLSKTVDKDKKGVLFSGVGVLQAVCTLLASVIYNSLYPAMREIYPGLCFFIMAAALTVPFILTILLHIGSKHSGICYHDNSSISQQSEDDSEALLDSEI